MNEEIPLTPPPAQINQLEKDRAYELSVTEDWKIYNVSGAGSVTDAALNASRHSISVPPHAIRRYLYILNNLLYDDLGNGPTRWYSRAIIRLWRLGTKVGEFRSSNGNYNYHDYPYQSFSNTASQAALRIRANDSSANLMGEYVCYPLCLAVTCDSVTLELTQVSRGDSQRRDLVAGLYCVSEYPAMIPHTFL